MCKKQLLSRKTTTTNPYLFVFFGFWFLVFVFFFGFCYLDFLFMSLILSGNVYLTLEIECKKV